MYQDTPAAPSTSLVTTEKDTQEAGYSVGTSPQSYNQTGESTKGQAGILTKMGRKHAVWYQV